MFNLDWKLTEVFTSKKAGWNKGISAHSKRNDLQLKLLFEMHLTIILHLIIPFDNWSIIDNSSTDRFLVGMRSGLSETQ